MLGINLLREGLDIPECALVAILDADKEGYLRSARSLIQTVGRAARHENGRVIMYADRVTKSMETCIGETDRRRQKQVDHNLAHGITPRSVIKGIGSMLQTSYEEDEDTGAMLVAEDEPVYGNRADLDKKLSKMRKEMLDAAKSLEFERAAKLRDEIAKLERQILVL